MPPRPSPSSLTCSRCSHHLQWTRYQSTTAEATKTTTTRAAQAARPESRFPPESPKFIPVPEAVQAPYYTPIKPVKGILPTPRNIFSRHREYRASPEYLAQVTPEPKARNEPHGPEAARINYKHQLSFLRRQTLREGISEIAANTQKRADLRKKVGGMKQAGNLRKAREPSPLDEVLTSQTLHPSVRLLLATGNIPGPTTPSPSKYPFTLATRSQKRREALHNLYVNAQHFIVTQDQLDKEIDKVFGSDERPLRWNETNGVWGLSEKPLTSGEMLDGERVGRGSEVDVKGKERLNRIAEVLTGGRGSDLGKEKRVGR